MHPDSASRLYVRHRDRLVALAQFRGCDYHSAQDLVQEIFVQLLSLRQVGELAPLPDEQQFTFLSVRLKSHFINRWRRQMALKRGGEHSINLALDESLQVPSQHPDPAATMDIQWARRVMEGAVHRVFRRFEPRARAQMEARLHRDQGNKIRTTSQQRASLMRARRRITSVISDSTKEELVAIVASL